MLSKGLPRQYMQTPTGRHDLLGVGVSVLSEDDLVTLIVGCACGVRLEPCSVTHEHLIRIVMALSDSLSAANLQKVQRALAQNAPPPTSYVGAVTNLLLNPTTTGLATFALTALMEIPP